MTYPQQHGPSGQPQYGQQQYGGYPPQPGQYGGGYGGGYGAPPPKKSNGPVIAVVLFVVVLLGGLGITGFVAPGFFLSDDSSEADGGSGGSKGTDGGAANAGDENSADTAVKQLAEKLVQAADEQDESALRDLACDDAKAGVRQAIKEIKLTSGAKLVETKKVADDEYVAVVDITVKTKNMPYAATLSNGDGDWCWMNFGSGTGGGSGGDSADDGPSAPTSDKSDTGGGSGNTVDGRTAMQEFLDAVNRGDGAKATDMFCDSTRSQGSSTVKDAVSKDANLKIGELQDPDGKFQRGRLAGTLDGKELSSGLISVRIEGRTAGCVVSFIIR